MGRKKLTKEQMTKFWANYGNREKKITIYAANYCRMEKLGIFTVNENNQHKKAESTEFMPLELRWLRREKMEVYSIAHYFEENGKKIFDPCVTFIINHQQKTVEAITITQPDGKYSQVYHAKDGNPYALCDETEKADLNIFFRIWLITIKKQGFSFKE